MRHCWRGSAGWLQQYRKQKGELQGRTPNSELQEFGVRPCNSPFCYSLFSDTWSIHTVPAIELSNRHDGRRKTRISTSLTGESTMSFPPSFFQSVVPFKRSVSISGRLDCASSTRKPTPSSVVIPEVRTKLSSR